MDWIDAHCHLSDVRVQSSLTQIIMDCAQAGIDRFVLGGVDSADWDRQEELSRSFPGKITKVFGLHPWWVDGVVSRPRQAQDLESHAGVLEAALRLLEIRLPECAALGETGLDAGRDRFKRSRAEQLMAFEAQLELAHKFSRPVVLHVVRSHPLALQTLTRLRHSVTHGGLVHSFSGTWADAVRYLDLGLTLSVSARVTYPDAHDLHETVRRAPADRLVFETDAPDQAPHGAVEKVHTPLSLLKVVQQVSELRQEPLRKLLDRSRDNLKRLLKI